MNTTEKTMPFYQLTTSEVLEALRASKEGLTQAEATQRLAVQGPNSLKKLRTEPAIVKYFRQFKDLMILLLLGCAGVAFYLDDARTGGILVSIVLINSLIGFAQEHKAEKVMESLKSLMVPEAKVLRDGHMTTIDSSQLVVGDIIQIEEGDSIPADGRILEESEVATNDFALTGESNPCRKFTHAIKGRAPIGDQRNLVFMGTTVASGNALCVVVGTGMRTELGRIASLSQETKAGVSPLQKEMNNLAFRITMATLVLVVILVAISLGADLSIKDALIFAIGIASAMIPQGLPAEVSVSLAQAAGKLAEERALVKKLSAVETLGSTSIICTDKTGTLTKNEMTVERLILVGKQYSVSGTGYEPVGKIHDEGGAPLSEQETRNLHQFIVTGYFATNAKISSPDEHHPNWYCLGDPTEGALVTLTQKAGLDTRAVDEASPELKEFPFDSVRKRMSSIRRYNDSLTVFVKGAPESVLDVCSRIWLPDGTVRKLTSTDKKMIREQNDEFAQKAMRNLAYAYKTIDEKVDYTIHDPDVVEHDLIYMGLVSMIDPVRDDVADAMVTARNAHIKVSIITGDYAPTAKAIAVRANLAEKPEDIIIVTGDELPAMPDEKVLELVLRGSIIFSRVSPEDKLRIVGLVKSHSHVVAVTGDGINDAPALKRADIGVAMGRTGTDVAKQSAEIILLDDSFHTLVGAIQQGRTVYQNIRKATLSCLTSNFGELITVLIGLAALSLAGIPPAISPVLILAIDLIAELFPIAALGWDKPEGSLMRDYPRDPKDHIYNTSAFVDLLVSGLLIGGLAYGNFIYFAHRNGIEPSALEASGRYLSAITLTYTTIVLCQFVNILLRRTRGTTISRYLFSNKQLWIAMGLSLFCVVSIVYIPVVQKVFGSDSLNVTDWFFAVASACIYFVIRETLKLLVGIRQQKHDSTVAV